MGIFGNGYEIVYGLECDVYFWFGGMLLCNVG